MRPNYNLISFSTLVETGEAPSLGETRYIGMDYAKQSIDTASNTDLVLVRTH
jgi:hypothetical protein